MDHSDGQMKYYINEILRPRIADMRGRGIYSGYPDTYKCIFIHIPKTAGTSLVRTLFDTDSRHLRYREYEKANPQKFARYFKFTFVRNPWDRLYSAFSFLKKGGMHEADRRWAEENLSSYADFDNFVKGWVNPENVWSCIHFYPQHYFICDDQLNLKMDFVGRFESLKDDFMIVQQRLCLPVKSLPIINASAKKNAYIQHYNDETRKIVSETYAEDIKMFSYLFDNR